MTTYKVVFDRIGRTHDVTPLTTSAVTLDHLAFQIAEYARPYLRSSDYQVVVDIERGRGSIEAGRFGRFTVASTEATS